MKHAILVMALAAGGVASAQTLPTPVPASPSANPNIPVVAGKTHEEISALKIAVRRSKGHVATSTSSPSPVPANPAP